MTRTLSTFAPSLLVAALSFTIAGPARADVAPPEPAPNVEPAKPEPAKTETKSETKTETKSETKSGSCSIQDDSRSVLGLAALVLLISGASLRRRAAKRV